MAVIHRVDSELAEEYRAVHLERLEQMIRVLQEKVDGGDLGAHAQLRAHLEREAKLLGLDSPEQVDHRVVSKALIHVDVDRV